MAKCYTRQDLENATYEVVTDAPFVARQRVTDEDAQLILNDILVALGGGTPFHQSVASTSTPGTEQTLINVTVPASTTRVLSQVVVTSTQRVKYTVYVDGNLVGSGRTGAGNYSDSFKWQPGFEAAENLSIQVKVLQTGGPASDVEAHLMATDK